MNLPLMWHLTLTDSSSLRDSHRQYMSTLCHAHDKFNPLVLINSSARDPEKEIEIQSGWLLSRTCETLTYIVITILVERLKLVHLAVFTRD